MKNINKNEVKELFVDMKLSKKESEIIKGGDGFVGGGNGGTSVPGGTPGAWLCVGSECNPSCNTCTQCVTTCSTTCMICSNSACDPICITKW